VAPKRKGKVVEFKEDLEEICLFSAKISWKSINVFFSDEVERTPDSPWEDESAAHTDTVGLKKNY
jgi:hypothetical protein